MGGLERKKDGEGEPGSGRSGRDGGLKRPRGHRRGRVPLRCLTPPSLPAGWLLAAQVTSSVTGCICGSALDDTPFLRFLTRGLLRRSEGTCLQVLCPRISPRTRALSVSSWWTPCRGHFFPTVFPLTRGRKLTADVCSDLWSWDHRHSSFLPTQPAFRRQVWPREAV